METNPEFFRSLALTLVHSLWEGAVLMVLILFILSIIGKRNSQYRYVVLLTGLMLLLAGFIVTFFIVYYRFPAPEIRMNASALPSIIPVNYATLPAWPDGPGRLLRVFLQTVEQFSPILAIGWLFGFLFSGIKMMGGLYISYNFVKKQVFMPEQSLLALFDRIKSDLLIPAAVQLRLTSRKISPMVIGLFKPVVIVPLAALAGLNPGQVESLLLHELAHLRRFDHWIVILQAIASQVLFFHPVAWYLCAELNHERENCCDDIVTKTCDPINYIKALTMIQEMNFSGPLPANALTGRSNRLLQRVKRLLKPEIKHSPVFRIAVVFLFFITMGIAAITFTAAKSTDNNPAPPKDPSKGIAGILSDRDTTRHTLINGTVNKNVTDNKSGQTKKIKIVFENDTVKEMTVNGNAIPREEIIGYEDDIREIREGVEGSDRALEKAANELKRAEEELFRAREEVMRARENLRSRQLAEINEEVKRSMESMHIEQNQLKQLYEGDVREAMDRARFEAQKAYKEAQNHWGKISKQDWEEFQEQFQKSQEQIKESMEEFFQLHGDSARFFYLPQPLGNMFPGDGMVMPPIPPLPEFDIDDIPPLEEGNE